MSVQVHEIKPEDFKTSVQVSACYIEVDGHLLLLQCSSAKEEAGKWGVPGGKAEINELPEDTAKRELFEETGIQVEHSDLESMGRLYFRKTEVDYVYHLFRVSLSKRPEVRLSSEHPTYCWAKFQELDSLPLMAGSNEALHKYQGAISKKRITASVNVYLILQNKGKVLLLLRQNTGYLDNYWGLPSGHVEAGESATKGMIREAREEIGITISPDNLQTAHVMHRKTNRLNIDIFFKCTEWKGKIENKEPEKCGGVHFFAYDFLPTNIVDYIGFSLNESKRGEFYSEWGFV